MSKFRKNLWEKKELRKISSTKFPSFCKLGNIIVKFNFTAESLGAKDSFRIMPQYQGQEPEGELKILAQNMPFQHVLNSTSALSSTHTSPGELSKMQVLVQGI